MRTWRRYRRLRSRTYGIRRTAKPVVHGYSATVVCFGDALDIHQAPGRRRGRHGDVSILIRGWSGPATWNWSGGRTPAPLTGVLATRKYPLPCKRRGSKRAKVSSVVYRCLQVGYGIQEIGYVIINTGHDRTLHYRLNKRALSDNLDYFPSKTKHYSSPRRLNLRFLSDTSFDILCVYALLTDIIIPDELGTVK